MIQDLKNMNQDTRIAQHIIESRRRGVPEQLVDMGIKIDPSILSDDKIIEKDNDDNEIFSVQMFRKYVAYAKRQVFPELDDAATKMLIEYYTKARNEYRDEDDKVIISARALEALIRLSEAHARMHLREVAGIVDAEQAIGMYKLWRYELMGDEYDELTIQTGDSTRKRSADRVVSGIVRNLCRELGECQTNDIYNTANEAGFDEDTVDRVLRALQQRGTFYSPTPDTWRLA
jgi:replicative DNA helicase Mcm